MNTRTVITSPAVEIIHAEIEFHIADGKVKFALIKTKEMLNTTQAAAFEMPADLQDELDSADALDDDPENTTELKYARQMYQRVINRLTLLSKGANITKEMRQRINDALAGVRSSIADIDSSSVMEKVKQNVTDMVSKIGSAFVDTGDAATVGDAKLVYKRYDPVQGKWLEEIAPTFADVQKWRKDVEIKRDAAEAAKNRLLASYNRLGQNKPIKEPWLSRWKAQRADIWKRYQRKLAEWRNLKVLAEDAVQAEGRYLVPNEQTKADAIAKAVRIEE